MTRVRRRWRGIAIGAILVAGAARAAAQRVPPRGDRHPPDAAADPPIPVVAVGSGTGFAAALAQAVRMAVESGAGAMLASAITVRGDRVVSDSIHTVSRGIVTRYVLLDSARSHGTVHVRILAMVSRIREQPLTPVPGTSVRVPGDLWAAGDAIDAERRRAEGEIVQSIFADIEHQPSLYAYRVAPGPAVPDGDRLRMRVLLIRTPNANYAAAMQRAEAILSAIAGPGGERRLRYPPTTAQVRMVHPCVSRCGPDSRRLLDARAVLAPTDSFAGFDPPVVTAGAPDRVPALFPALSTAGGFAVAFVDRAAERARYVHLRSTAAFFAVVDYLRTVVDEARMRLVVGDRAVTLRQVFRAPWSGAFDPALLTADSQPAVRVRLVRPFRERTSGGPGTPVVAGAQDVVLWVQVGRAVRADTAVVDLWFTPPQLASLRELRVEPLEIDHRLPPVRCRVAFAHWPNGTADSIRVCDHPAPVDDFRRPLGSTGP